jgi:hypothetical protein
MVNCAVLIPTLILTNGFPLNKCNGDFSPTGRSMPNQFFRVYSRLLLRVATACDILRGIVSPCRWCEFVEPTIAKRVVETAQANIKRTFHGYPGGLHNASCELICGKLKASVTNPHSVVLTAARAAPKARRVSSSRDPISAGNQLPIRTVVYTFHPIFPDTSAAHIELPVLNFKLRTDSPRTDPDVRKSRIKEARCSA